MGCIDTSTSFLVVSQYSEWRPYPDLDASGGEVSDGLSDAVLQLVLDGRRPQKPKVLLDHVVARVKLLLTVLKRHSHLGKSGIE